MTTDQVAQVAIGLMLAGSMWMQRRNDVKTDKAKKAADAAATVSAKNNVVVNQTHQDVQTLAFRVNGNLDEMLRMARAEAKKEGIEIGRAQIIAEQAAAAKAAPDIGGSVRT